MHDGGLTELDGWQDALNTFEDSSLSFENRLEALKDIIPDGKKFVFDVVSIGRVDDKLYMINGARDVFEINKDFIDKAADVLSECRKHI